MLPPSRTLLTTAALAVALSGFGYDAWHSPAKADEQMQMENPSSNDDKGKILFYRSMGGETSPVPKKDSMGMDYVPVYESEIKGESGLVQISPDRIQKLGVQTGTAERRNLAQDVHAVGTIQIDETRQTVIAPRFDGWIEKLDANATGMQVKKGDALFTFYSPQVVNIEAEYPFTSGHGVEDTATARPHTGPHNGTIEKLQTLAVPDDEIERLRHDHTANYHITLRAPADGTILEKQAVEGMKFSAGDMLYRLADLSHVWMIVDVYEQDLSRIAVGQPAKVTISAYPGRVFDGAVAFIYPGINKDTRTAKVRIDLSNPTGELRLDMYADVNVGGVAENDVLSVPASAVLNSGERQAVLLDLGDGRFRPQAVKTGMRSGDYVEILDGLKEGDRVVTSANFLIDSESNLRAALQGFAAKDSKP